MKQNAYIAGVGMTAVGNHLARSLKSLATEAVRGALEDAGIRKQALEAAWVGNVGAGVLSGQVCVLGQVMLRSMGIGAIPVVNVENACASSSTAFQQACSMVTMGAHDVVLACGVEKLFNEDKRKTFSVFSGGVDIEQTDALLTEIGTKLEGLGMGLDASGAGTNRSLFMDIYASWALDHMQKYGTTQKQLATVSAKNSRHGNLNPLAQYRDVVTVEEVLAEREILWPLTLPMCCPIGDGAAAMVIVSERKARQLGMSRMVKVEASLLCSGWDYTAGEEEPARYCANQLYDAAGIGSQDLDVIELHDASAISEIMYYEYLGLCPMGDGGRLVEEGHTALGGRIPVNTSGGLLRKGHPIGATGAAQIVELVQQLRGEAGDRQVNGAGVALAENGGGYIGNDVAALVLTLLRRT